MDLIDRAEVIQALQPKNNIADSKYIFTSDTAKYFVRNLPKVDAVPMSAIEKIEKALIENVDRIENDDLRIAIAIFISEALDDIREIVKEHET